MNRDEARKEILKIYAEYPKKSAKIIEEAKANGTWPMGLDGDKELFAELDRETKDRIQAVIDMIDE